MSMLSTRRDFDAAADGDGSSGGGLFEAEEDFERLEAEALEAAAEEGAATVACFRAAIDGVDSAGSLRFLEALTVLLSFFAADAAARRSRRRRSCSECVLGVVTQIANRNAKKKKEKK